MDTNKLKEAIGQKVFVVLLTHGVLRTSSYGKLEVVNDPVNIILDDRMSTHVIPINNGKDKILKVYDKQGYVVYDAETKVEDTENLADAEKKMIQASLQLHRGKRKLVANELGISERTLYRKIKELGI